MAGQNDRHFHDQIDRIDMPQAKIDQEDITESVRTLYGEDRDWNQRVIRFRDFLTSKDLGRDLCLKWLRKNGRVDCVITRIRDLDAALHGDMFHTSTQSHK